MYAWCNMVVHLDLCCSSCTYESKPLCFNTCRSEMREIRVLPWKYNSQLLFFLTFTWLCIITDFFVMKPTSALISQIFFVMKLYMFRTVRLSIVRSLFTVHSAMVYVIQVCRQLSSRTRSCSKAVYKPVWHIPLLSVQWINSWRWIDELSETCRVSWQNKSVKLVHLVGFITKKSELLLVLLSYMS